MPTLRSTLSRIPPTVAYLAFGAMLIGLHASLELGGQPQALTYDIVGASAVGAALFGAWRNRPDRRLPLILIAVGQASFVAGDLLWTYFEAVFRETDPAARAARDKTWLDRGPTVRRREPLRLAEPRLEPRAG